MCRRIRLADFAVFGVLFFALAGCAWVDAVPAPPGSDVSGIRIYDIKPLLVVSSSGVNVIFVPNYNRAYALRFGAFLAKHDLTVEFQNGTVSKITSNQDSTAVPIAFLQTINEALKAGASLGSVFAEKANTNGGRIQVYDLIFDPDGELVGARPIIMDRDLVRVPSVNPVANVAGTGGKPIKGGQTPGGESGDSGKTGTGKDGAAPVKKMPNGS